MSNGNNRINEFERNELLDRALVMRDSLKEGGKDEADAVREVLRKLLSAVTGVIAQKDEKPIPVHEFIFVLASTTPTDPNVKFSHSAWIKNDKASDLAQGYGMVAAFGQYYATSLLARHIHPDDVERAFKDLYAAMEAHIGQLREHERQQALGGDEKEEKTPGGPVG